VQKQRKRKIVAKFLVQELKIKKNRCKIFSAKKIVKFLVQEQKKSCDGLKANGIKLAREREGDRVAEHTAICSKASWGRAVQHVVKVTECCYLTVNNRM